MKTRIIPSIPFGWFLALVAIVPLAAYAAPSVNPGETLLFAHADGGGTQCRTADGSLPDTVNCSGATTFNASQNHVRAVFHATLPINSLGKAHYSTAWVYNDFSIPGNPTNLVDAQISVKFDCVGEILATAAYDAKATVTLEVDDITPGGPVLPVTSSTIFQQERSGSQGFTDISSGADLEYPRGDTASIQVKLRRGRTYRITFKAETLSEAFGIGEILGDCSATWNQLSVTAGADQVELLSQHDADIKSAIATHDADIKAAIAAHDTTMKAALALHDADIKHKLDELDGKLTDISAKLDEIKSLLLTPQGRRPGFPLKQEKKH